MIKAIVFDCFGVVISDALEALMKPLRTADPELNDKVVKVLHEHNFGMTNPDESNRRLADLLGFTPVEYRRRIDAGEVKDQALLKYILDLKQTYKTAMLSNIDSSGLRRRFEPGELDEHFGVVVASGDIGIAKPDSRAYAYVAEQLKVRLDECLFTDDRIEYCDAARAVGMQAILYKDLSQFKADLARTLSQPGN